MTKKEIQVNKTSQNRKGDMEKERVSRIWNISCVFVESTTNKI